MRLRSVSSGLFTGIPSLRRTTRLFQTLHEDNQLPPITKWRDELAAMTAEKDALYREYVALKDGTAKVERIKRSVAEIIKGETGAPKRTPKKSLDVEL